MSTPRHGDLLSWEQSVNERYLDKTQQRNDQMARLGSNTVSTLRNTEWTGGAPRMPRAGGPTAPLVGRVALSPADEDLGHSFYIGNRYELLEDGITVVSWAADVARLFFEGRDARVRRPESPQPRLVAARRSFKSRGDRLVDFEDDVEPGADADSAFLGAARLSVPAPPAAVPRTAPAAAHGSPIRREGTPARWQEAPAAEEQRLPRGRTTNEQCSVADYATTPEHSLVTDKAEPRTGTPDPEGSADARADDRRRTDTAERAQRAARLLEEALEAPKTGTLAPVLATLQPKQYRLVTWPSERNLVVQGHPGTGKTIVAAHRAAYLVLPKDAGGEDRRLHRVALVGPTDRWKGHIEPSVSRLVEEGVEVLSLESLVRESAGDLYRPLHPVNERWFHSLWEIGRIVDRAARTLDTRLRKLRRPTQRARELVNELVRDTETHRRVVPGDQEELKQWLLQAESYEGACKGSSYLLFLAAIGIVVGRVRKHHRYQHIVVDEAQDIRPVEWWLLTKLYGAGTEARWSVLGDMNQRRSDFTWESWEELTDRLELAGADEEPVAPEMLGSGYRSTREILRYADALLPRAMRGHNALRSGPEPSVRQVGPTQLVEATAAAAARLAIRHHQGSVAVIAWDQSSVRQIEQSLLKEGWRRDAGDSTVLRRPLGGARVSVSRPVEVRGLEFDAVVVAEPADFSPNVGRAGELYTSLSRANRELAVIHSKAMPRQLKGRGCRVK